MAYDQGYYQQPQRPHNGRAAQRPGPSQGYAQPPQQQYSAQGHEQYPQDGYGYDSYDNGYGQDYGGNGGHQDMNPGGRGNGYPPQNQNYRPQQDYYGGARGGGGMPPPTRGRGGPMQRPPTSDGTRGGYDQRSGGQGRGYPNGGGPPMGRGGRPAPLERATSSDPGMRAARKPLKTPPISPDQAAWDNPFPTFPGAKKKTSMSEEQKIIQQMASIEIGGTPHQNRPRTAGSKGSHDRYPGGPSPTDDYGLPSIESQRGMPPRAHPPHGPPQGPPQQGYQDQRRGPPPPRQNGYAEPTYNDRGGYGAAAPVSPVRPDFGSPPSRSMTMPNELSMGMTSGRQPPMPMGGPLAEERPYNGPIGRGMPPRPSTATGTRQPPQRTYPNPDPVQPPPQQYHRPNESISDFYDSYYDSQNGRDISNSSEMPNFDAVPVTSGSHKRGSSFDGPIQPRPAAQPGNSFGLQNGYKQVMPMKSQPDFRAQPQAAVFDMATDAPPLPNAYSDDRFGAQSGQYNGQQPGNLRGPPPPQEYGGYDEPHSQNGFPPQSTSSGPRNNGPGLPSGPRSGFGGLPNGPKLNGLVPQPLSPDALPSHPPPVRAGLIPNSVANQANNKPPPVRNYNNVTPAQQPTSSQAAPQATPTAPPPVTLAELEQMKSAIKVNPNDQGTQMLLARKLVEACDVLVPSMPDQRARNKAREKYVLDAHKLLKKLVAAQNTEAMFYLADSYGRGALGLETDNKEAFSLYQSAAKAGHAGAAYRTAVCCELGNEEGGGTRKDPLKAVQWYKRAAMLGDTPGMYKMGMILLKGLLGQPKNPREAVGWLKRAAERADKENPHALHELGLLYEQPQGGDGSIMRDEAYSFSLFQQAAELGYKFSQFRMGCAYEYGLFNCPIDPRQSIMWYSRAAIQEEHQSELALSGWYLTGSEGVLQQSDTEAYLWARKAAMAGLAKAEYAMGYFTEVGIGSPASLEDAKRWYWRAAAQNFPKARDRLEDLKRGGSKPILKSRERISRSKVGKQNEGECGIM